MALVTFIVVTLNARDGIERTFASLADQTSRDFNVLVVDGVSTDGTLDVVDLYKDRMRINATSEPDKGLYDAMNKGIARADGEYVLFLNAGDKLDDQKVVEDLCLMLDASNTRPVMIYGTTKLVFHDGRQKIRQIRSMNYIRHGQPTLHQSVFFRRDVHQKFPYPYEKYPISSDYLVMANIQKNFGDEIAIWPRVISSFHNDPSGVSNRNLWPRVKEAWKAQRDVISVGLGRRIYSAFRRISAHGYYNFRYFRN